MQPSDPAVALAALDAVVDVVGPAGPRAIPSTGFHLTPEEAGLQEHRLAPDELIVGYRIPIEPGAQAYVKIRERASYEYAIVSAAAVVGPDRARVALGSVAGKPWRLPDLVGVPLTPGGAAARRRGTHGRRRPVAAQRVQGDHGPQRRGARRPHRGGAR